MDLSFPSYGKLLCFLCSLVLVLPIPIPYSTSNVRITLYKRVSDLEHKRFYSELNNRNHGSSLQNAKNFRGAIPFSNIEYKVFHDTPKPYIPSIRPEEIDLVGGFAIGDRKVTSNSNNNFIIANRNPISFPENKPTLEDIVVGNSDKNNTTNQTNNNAKKNRPFHSSSIFFPDQLPESSSSKPTFMITLKPIPTSTTSTTTTPEVTTNKSTEDANEDKELLDEFLNWVNTNVQS